MNYHIPFHPILNFIMLESESIKINWPFRFYGSNHLEFAIVVIEWFFMNFSLSTSPLSYTLICNSNPFILNRRFDSSPINDLFLLLEPSSKNYEFATV